MFGAVTPRSSSFFYLSFALDGLRRPRRVREIRTSLQPLEAFSSLHLDKTVWARRTN